MTPKPLLKTPTPLFWSARGRAPKEWSAVICCMQTPEFLGTGARAQRSGATRRESARGRQSGQYKRLYCNAFRAGAAARELHRDAAPGPQPVAALERLIVWGNHSSIMYPDIRFATVCGAPVQRRIQEDWLRDVFIPSVAQRGAAIINSCFFKATATA